MPDKKPNMLDLFKQMLDDHLGKDEFVKSFENVVSYVKKFEERLGNDFAALSQTIQQLSTDLQSLANNVIADLKQTVDTRLNAAISQANTAVQDFLSDAQEEQQAAIEYLYDRVDRIKDGETPSDEKLTSLIKPLIPAPVKGEDGKDATLDMETINRRFAQMQEAVTRASARGARKTTYIKRYNLTSQVDGNTKTFTLPPDTIEVVGVFGTQFPINFNPNVDWTFSGRTLTLTDEVAAPQSGQTLYALIEVMFY